MDEELLDPRSARLESQDVGILPQVFAASYRRLVVQLYGVIGDYSEAEDAVQEAFVRASLHRARFEATLNPEAWLRAVAINVHRNRWRKLRNFARIRHRLVEAVDLPGLGETHLELMAALRSLPETQREVVALHHLVDLSVDEVADLLGCPTGTVKSRLARGRAALEAALGAMEVGADG
ncbi:RNA polymerase sigma factor [Nocardioides sp.]|uniref:RNA polymerase sigma factor n=1 Tax=Nocardioides sp. TaxID=35761 RepID=UPI003526C90F